MRTKQLEERRKGKSARAAQQARIERLKEQARALCGGDMMVGSFEKELPLDVIEQFWEQVVTCETAPCGREFDRLQSVGVTLPAPDTLTDDALRAKLWEVIGKLAELQVFLSQTDHLSDRALYEVLWSDILRRETTIEPPQPDTAWHLDILGGCSEEDTENWLKFYADEGTRELWQKDFPGYAIPAHRDPPFDRDRHLPAPAYG